MPEYRRVREPGGCYFFTVNLLERKRTLLVGRSADLMRAIRIVKRARPFRLDCLVLLPDHLHVIWTLPDGDSDYPSRWRLIKMRFARAIPRNEWPSVTRVARRERGIWQRRFWEHLVRNDEEYAELVAYCYQNPVAHGHVERVADWPYSTYHRDVRAGLFEADWEPLVSKDGGPWEKNDEDPCLRRAD